MQSVLHHYTVAMNITPGSGGRFPGSAASAHAPQRVNEGAMRVLVADDNADAAQTTAMLLEMWGYDVLVAENGSQALEFAERFRPEIALIDVGMPDMNGYQVAETLRRTPHGRNAKLIAVTGWGQEADKLEASRAGFDHHLTKPVEPTHLQPLLESLQSKILAANSPA